MKTELYLITITFLCITACNPSTKKDSKQNPIVTFDSLAVTPPMGWNSYNCFGATVRESEVKANADFLAGNLKKHGWQYIVVDYCWFYPHHPGSIQDNPPQFRLPKDGSYVPWLAMDQFGRLFPYVGKFPSCTSDQGFKPLADYIHQQGLKFGIHVMRGIPRQAVWAKTPVKGTNGINAAMIADTSSTCGWLNSMYGLDMSKTGSQEYLNSLFELYGQWGVDFIKVDDLSSPYYLPEIEGYRKAIAQCGRPIVFSTSPGATPIAEGSHVMNHANMWRVSGDFWDNWEQLNKMFELAHQWSPYRKHGHWPDLDMLQLGRLSRRGPVGNERETRFTQNEQYTHFTLWCIAKSPLMMGGDLTVADQFTLSLLSNNEVIAVDQQSENNHEVRNQNGIVIWTADQPGTRSKYMAVFNTNDGKTESIVVSWSEIGVTGELKVRDLWTKKDLGKFKEELSVNVEPHGCRLFRIGE